MKPRKKYKYRLIKPVIEARLIGLGLTAFAILSTYVLDGDATAAFFALPLGLAGLFMSPKTILEQEDARND